MSKSFLMDDSNGNGLFAKKISSTNGASSIQLPSSMSSDDLSQSLSEYTDADESISAPTEFLAEFLAALMQKDYKKAFKYCKLILQYEPNNTTAKEFYPLIMEKLKETSTSESDENYNKSSSPDVEDDLSNEEELDAIALIEVDENSDESEDAQVDEGEEEDDDDDEEEERSECPSSSSESECGDEQEISSEYEENNLNVLRDSRNSSGSGSARSRSDNTTHSYSSLLLEEEDDIVPTHLPLKKELSSPDLDLSNGNNVKSTSCSDSESPTEPLTQRLAAILRYK